MRAPALAHIDTVHPDSRSALPPLTTGPAVEHFVVVREGSCAHGHWGTGEVLVCRGEPADGDQVVLVARGHGRPRVGTVRKGRLYGDAGEPCHPDRWRVAGRLVATWRVRGEGWVCSLTDTSEHAGSAPVVASRERAVQLDLFAA